MKNWLSVSPALSLLFLLSKENATAFLAVAPLLHSDCLEGLDFVNVAFAICDPDRAGAGIMDFRTIHRAFQPSVISPCQVKLHVGAVPDVIFSGHLLAEFFDYIPVVFFFKFIGMAPNLEYFGRVLDPI